MKKKEFKQQIKLLESKVEELEGKVKLLEGIDPEKHIKKLYELVGTSMDNISRLHKCTEAEIGILKDSFKSGPLTKEEYEEAIGFKKEDEEEDLYN